jgi:hypothetical protein
MSLPSHRNLARLRTQAPREERLQLRTSSATSTLLPRRCQVTSFISVQLGAPLGLHIPKPYGFVPAACIIFSLFIQLGAPLGLHHSQVMWVRPYGMYCPLHLLEFA